MLHTSIKNIHCNLGLSYPQPASNDFNRNDAHKVPNQGFEELPI